MPESISSKAGKAFRKNAENLFQKCMETLLKICSFSLESLEESKLFFKIARAFSKNAVIAFLQKRRKLLAKLLRSFPKLYTL